jgi:hypothetical protein
MVGLEGGSLPGWEEIWLSAGLLAARKAREQGEGLRAHNAYT